jgi:general secretion pathway protein K
VKRAVGRDARGMILVNVLVIVMLATGVLAIMVASGDSDIERSSRLRFAAQAMAHARGGELSAIAALRRDLAASAAVDSLDEEWAKIADRKATIPGGRFSFAVIDAQSRFNINNLAREDIASREVFARIASAARLPGERVDRISALVQAAGAVTDLSALRTVGLTDAELVRLAALCTALPKPTPVNFNTAPEPVVAALLGNPAAARSLVMMRRGSRLTPEVLSGLTRVLPPGTSLTSDYFWTHGRVVIGGTSQQLTSLLHRTMQDGRPQVLAIRRWRGTPPLGAPLFP